MTDLCPTTGKPKLSSAQAQRQVQNTRRTVVAVRCKNCGRWHVNTAGVFQNRDQRRAPARIKEARAPRVEDEA